MFKSMNGGQTWIKWNMTTQPLKGLNVMRWLSWSDALAVGAEGTAYHVKSSGEFTEVDLHPEGNEYAVDEFMSLDFLDCAEGEFMATYGVVGVKYATASDDDEVNPQSAPISPKEFGIWYTTDSGDTWNESLSISGYPVYLTHYGDVYYLLTNYRTETKDLSALWKSEDYGHTWKYVANPKRYPHAIHFMDESHAVLAAEGAVLFTADGGKTWTQTFPAEGVDWTDVVQVGDRLLAIGSGCNVYETTDNGETWSKVDFEGDDSIELTALGNFDDAPIIAATGANFFFNGGEMEQGAYGPHMYDIEADTWTPLPFNGIISDGNAGNVYGVSGDGNMMVGNIHSFKQINSGSTVHGHAAAWVGDEVIDLGSMFDFQNRHTTAYAASYDGSVIVGCQDVFGPWFAAVWRKQADGSYKQEMMLKDPNKTIDDIEWNYVTDGNGNNIIPFLGNEANAAEFLGSCRSVSKNGKWIGGSGTENIGVLSPWIWSEETGLVLIDEDNSMDGSTSVVSEDGTMAAGWAGGGLIAWIWHKDEGSRYLTNYVSDVLGGDLDDHFLCSVYDMSPNGRYLVGWCSKGQGKFGYRIDLMAGVDGIEKNVCQTKAAVYPNPVATELHIDVPFDDVKATATLYDMQGRMTKRQALTGMSNQMDVSTLAQGFYILTVESEGMTKSFKIKVTR